MSSRLPSPSMLIALTALVMATTGSAIAAKHYLITSTTQIKPSVLKKLKGKRGPRGLIGPQGAQGNTGATGAAGTNGTNGSVGAAGLGVTADQTLPSGSTETGAYVTAATAVSERHAVVFEMRPKLPAPIAIGNVGFVAPGGPSTADCPGSAASPAAAPGHFCLYESLMTSMSLSSITKVDNSGQGIAPAGGTMFLLSTGGGATAMGTWAVTAP